MAKPTESKRDPKTAATTATDNEIDLDEPRPPGLIEVPLPRYPRTVLPTSDNWFKTTINPLVWHLVPGKQLPVTPRHDAFLAILNFEGFLLDATWTSHFWDLATSPMANRVRHRPDCLLYPPIAKELFRLLTSGRTRDRELASAAWKSLVEYRPHRTVTHSVRSPGIEFLEPERRTAKRQGREALLSDLEDQLVVWRIAVEESPSSQKDLVRRALEAPEGDRSDRTIRNHDKALDEYVSFLVDSEHLRSATVELYGKDEARARFVALQSLKDAIAWLGDPTA